MRLVTQTAEMRAAVGETKKQGKSIGLVPTMGYLHEGHLSLIRFARQFADCVITTIFVNPKQFGPAEDFGRYPRDFERDKALAESAGTDILFAPEVGEMYPEGYLTFVEVEKISDILEGKFRKAHFRGVATVVAKLFNITRPDSAVFGQKDAQQAAVIRQMVKDLNYGIKIVLCPTLREPDGLAMSSRNVYLAAEERKESTALWRSLLFARDLVRNGERHSSKIVAGMEKTIRESPHAVIDYISVACADSLEEIPAIKTGDEVLISLAVRIGSTRLIDNILITV